MNGRKNTGVAIAETAASMSLLIPLIVMIAFVAVETTEAYMIQSALSQAARRAARNLAIAYGQDPTIAASRSEQDAVVFQNIRIPNFVNSNAQFDDPQWNTSLQPYTTTVTVHYLSGQYGLPVFPQPDPLNLGNNLVITATSTYRLE